MTQKAILCTIVCQGTTVENHCFKPLPLKWGGKKVGWWVPLLPPFLPRNSKNGLVPIFIRLGWTHNHTGRKGWVEHRATLTGKNNPASAGDWTWIIVMAGNHTDHYSNMAPRVGHFYEISRFHSSLVIRIVRLTDSAAQHCRMLSHLMFLTAVKLIATH